MGNTDTEKELSLEKLEEAISYDGPHRWVSFEEYLERSTQKDSSGLSFGTGWPEFDYLIDNLRTKEFMVVSGIEGNGKSLFCRSLAYRLISQGIPVGFMSWEGNLLDALQPFKEIPNGKLFVPLSLEAGNPDWVIKECLRFKAKHDGAVIIIDHLHYVIDMNIQQNLSLNIGAFIRKIISEVCLKLNMLVILVAHQQSLDTNKQEPGIETVRDSSFIRQEPDLFITVHRQADPALIENRNASGKTYEQGYAMVKIDKARRKGTYRHRLTFQKKGNWLEPAC